MAQLQMDRRPDRGRRLSKREQRELIEQRIALLRQYIANGSQSAAVRAELEQLLAEQVSA